jgi:5-formyltetrahydrofolate cyclo-ligase
MSLPTPASGASKEVWRGWARRARETVDWDAVSGAVVAGVREWMQGNDATTVLVYVPMADEVNLTPLLEGDSGVRYVATRTPLRGTELTVHELGGPLEVHRFGFLQPHRSAAMVSPAEIDVALLPGLAFDLWGNRLGHGAGYFDRLLRATRPAARKVGVVPSALVVDRLPVEPHDIPVGFLATDEGVVATA